MANKLSNDLEIEVNELRSLANVELKLLHNIGDIWRVVNVYLQDLGITLKFHISESYPAIEPDIILSSSKVQQAILTQVTKEATTISAGLRGEKMLLPLYQFLVNSFANTKEKSTNAKHTKKHHRKTVNRQSYDVNEGKCQKLPSMKTAMDVVNRILWDAEVPKEDIIVGYLDRFLGVIEKPFISFSWEDIASVGYTDLAIPKHRIQYFKYKQVKIWDKKDKLDNVFGSMGSKTTIHDVLANYTEILCDDKNVRSPNCVDGDIASESDSDSSDNITVTINSDQLHTPENIGADGGISEDEEEIFNEYWENKLRPNYFIALRVTNPEIIKGVITIQDYITENDPDYETCRIPVEQLHITLCTLRLDSAEAVQHAVEALIQSKEELLEIIGSLDSLHLRCVDHFNSRVLYVNIDCSEEFMKMVDRLRMCLNENGFQFKDLHDFVPHMSIMKVSRPFCRENWSKRKLDPWLYSGFEECDFGCQQLDGIHLCEMGKARQADGFYNTALSMNFI